MLGISSFIYTLASLAVTVVASPGFVLHELASAVPAGFALHGPAPSETPLDLRFALRQNDIAGLEKVFLDISDPDSDKYGQHLSQQEVVTYVEPSADTVSKVNGWLSSHNLTATNASHAGDWIQVSIPAEKANKMLNADFSLFTHKGSDKQTIRTLAYSIPAELQNHIDLVHPTVNFPSFNMPKPTSGLQSPPAAIARGKTSGSLPASCAKTITPTCIQDLYGIPKTLATQQSNSLYVTGISGQSANRADLEAFLKANRPDLKSSTTFRDESVNGGTNSQNRKAAGYEANLDVQYTVGIASGVPVTFLSIGPSTVNNGFTDFLLNETHYLQAQHQVPHVLTTSYGVDEPGWSAKLVESVCNGFMQLGVRGTSVIFSSGDTGVGTGCDDAPFQPTFPSNCPYVTAVGATQLQGSKEVAATLSSGGFTNYFKTPAYQSAAVSSYTKRLVSKYAGRYNTSGRGIPDVSALGMNYLIEARGNTTLDDGTSCSAPVFASVIALLNDQLIAAGKSPLGFLNPFLYSSKGSAAFNDITSGNNPGCGTSGFPAKTGWDPVTGLGTPNFAKLKTAVGL